MADAPLLLYLINPGNPLVSMTRPSRWRRYRVWKPLGLAVLAALTPQPWVVRILDENLAPPDYARLPRPDLVGLTAFTAQAPRAYEIAAQFRAVGVRTILGGIHATFCTDEALNAVDTVVRSEAEDIWPTVLEDARHGRLQRLYQGNLADLTHVPPARHDLLARGYAFGSIQTTRGCPLNCRFCSVSAFNGQGYRFRPIPAVIDEFRLIPERLVLVVDDNLIGTRPEHITRAKQLFRAMIAADLRKKWICQTTINLGDDPELLELAARAGCIGTFIGFESLSEQGLTELGKRYNIRPHNDPRTGVRRIQRHGIAVVGSFILGLDCDTPGIGRRVARAAEHYGVDLLNPIFLTPFPGTRLWDQMLAQGRIAANHFPHDWRYYTLSFPVARYRHLSWHQLLVEMNTAWRRFYTPGRILRRLLRSLHQRRNPLVLLVANLSYRYNFNTDRTHVRQLDLARGPAWETPDDASQTLETALLPPVARLVQDPGSVSGSV